LCRASFNGTLFAYGQTSSGKTFTLMGSPIEPGMLFVRLRCVVL
jgi:centromeric protein E